jgi:hypothetical protein
MNSSLFAHSVAIIASASVAAISTSYAHTSFDGAWSVVITTDSGNCDPTKQLSIGIQDGSVQPVGDSTLSIRGQVHSNGQIRVYLTNGDRSASGYGQLSSGSGAGTWRGHGLASSCVGHWSAMRRWSWRTPPSPKRS